MDKLELVKSARRELGDVSAQELSSFIEQQHGVKIKPKVIPIFKASIRDKERLEVARHTARAALEQAKVEGGGPAHALVQAPVPVASPGA